MFPPSLIFSLLLRHDETLAFLSLPSVDKHYHQDHSVLFVLSIRRNEKMKKGKPSNNSSDIEKGGKVHSDTISEGFETLWDYVPCVIEQNDDTASNAEVAEVEKESIPNMTQSPIKIAQSESFFDDSKPPPMAIAASTSETDDDDEEIHHISKDQQLTDPFAPREGRTLCWRNVNMKLVRYRIF